MERDWTFFMLGTTKPYGVAIAIPILWGPLTSKLKEKGFALKLLMQLWQGTSSISSYFKQNTYNPSYNEEHKP